MQKTLIDPFELAGALPPVPSDGPLPLAETLPPPPPADDALPTKMLPGLTSFAGLRCWCSED